jgi:hypothetical protein
MRKIIVSKFMTLDNVIESPESGISSIGKKKSENSKFDELFHT